MKLTRIKKLFFTAVLGVAAVAFTGCSQALKSNVAFNADNTVNYAMSTGYDTQSWEMLASMDGTTVDELMKEYEAQGAIVSDETIDGVSYKLLTQAANNVPISNAETALAGVYQDVCLREDYFYAILDPSKSSLSYEDTMSKLSAADVPSDDESELTFYNTFSITFNAPVTSTNGTIDPANPNHVTWESRDAKNKMVIYASTAVVAEGATAKTDSVKNKKYYKSNQTINVANAENMVKMTIAKKSSVNGVALNPKNIQAGYVVKANGSYELKIWSKDGKCQTVSFVVDKKKPVVSGAKNGKTYKKVTLRFADAHSGVKSVTINGKKLSSKKYTGYTIKKAGKYKVVVTDKAGNKTTMNFKIKK